MEWDAAILCQLQVYEAIQPFHNPCATNVNTARSLFWIFPLLGQQLFPRWQTLQVSFAERVDQLKKNIWLTNWLFFFEAWEWHSAASQEKTIMVESCNLRCKRDSYFVTMYMWRAWNQNLSTHPPQCSAPSRLSHWNWMMAPGLWNGRIMGSMWQSQVPRCKTCELSKNIHRTFL